MSSSVASQRMSDQAVKFSRQTASYGAVGNRIFSSMVLVAFEPTTSVGTAAEILKNLALSGVREICLVEDGQTKIDHVQDFSSNSLMHPYFSSPEYKEDSPITMCAAAKIGLAELNPDLIVTVQNQAPGASWLETTKNAVKAKFASLKERASACCILLHPHDRRDNSVLGNAFSEFEAAKIPYIHVQSASLYGRITNWFGDTFTVSNASATNPTTATVDLVGVARPEDGSSSSSTSASASSATAMTASSSSSSADSQLSSAEKEKRRKYTGPFLTLLLEDMEADSVSGKPVSEDDTFKLTYTGDINSQRAKENNHQLLCDMLEKLSSEKFGGFVTRAVETEIDKESGKENYRFFFSTVNSDQQQNSAELLQNFCTGAKETRFPLRFAANPPVMNIDNFDVAPLHSDDIQDATLLFRALTRFSVSSGPGAAASPRIHSKEDTDAVSMHLHEVACKAAGENTPALLASLDPALANRARQFARTARLQPTFWCTYLGAYGAQEALKFITTRWIPITSPYCFDMQHLLPEGMHRGRSEMQSEPATPQVDPNDFFPRDAIPGASPTSPRVDDTDLHYACLFGRAQLDSVRSARLFLVGCGALGAELSKEMALCGLGSKGKGQIVLTDNDSIAVSNLTRQLLFRQHDVGRNKAEVAGNVIVKMSQIALKSLKSKTKVRPLQLKLDEESTNPVSGVFNHNFFKSQAVLIGGVDNAKAREFLSELSTQHLLPLVDGGTNGPLGHSSTVLSFVTNPLPPPNSSVATIPDNKIHLYPSTIAHCCGWAKLQFTGIFGQALPSNIIPKNIEDGFRKAFQVFFPIAVGPLLNLRATRPPGHLDKDGVTPYYNNHRRCPEVPVFDLKDPVQRAFLISFGRLWLRIHGVKHEAALDSDEAVMLAQADKEDWNGKMKKIYQEYVPTKVAIPNEENEDDDHEHKPKEDGAAAAAKKAEAEAAAERKKMLLASSQQNSEDSQQQEADFETTAEDFEKDDNDHVDVVWALTAMHAKSYSIGDPSRAEVQRVAGRMVSALITTTAAVCGASMFSILVTLLHHNTTTHVVKAQSRDDPYLAPLVALQDLRQASIRVQDFMINMACGPAGAFYFQQVDDERNVDVENVWAWRRPQLRLSPNDFKFSLGDMCERIVQLRLNQAVSAARRAQHTENKRIPLEQRLAPGIAEVFNIDIEAAGESASEMTDCDASNLFKKCIVILKICIGVAKTAHLVEHVPSGDRPKHLFEFPAGMFISTYIKPEVKQGEEAPPLAPFYEAELSLSVPAAAAAAGETQKKETASMIIRARLHLS